jgi:hypothetical protein
MISKRTIMRLLVAGGCVTAVSVAQAAGKPAASESTRHAAARGGPAHATSVRARTAARAQLRVLRTPREMQKDTIPAGLRRARLLPDGAVDLTAARQVPAAGGERAWIVPSADGASVCAVREGAVACPSAALLEITGLSPGINGRAGEPFHVWGIAGDDVSSIVLVQADGSRTSVSVTDNFFDVEADDWPRALTWTGPAGAESFAFPAYPD